MSEKRWRCRATRPQARQRCADAPCSLTFAESTPTPPAWPTGVKGPLRTAQAAVAEPHAHCFVLHFSLTADPVTPSGASWWGGSRCI